MTRALALLLGIDHVTSIDHVDLTLAAPWAREGAFWIVAAVLAIIIGCVTFYLKYQQKGPPSIRWALGLSRGALLALLLVMLADPILELSVLHGQKPYLYVIFDGTESMAIQDELSTVERAGIERAVDWRPAAGVEKPHPSRMDYLRALIEKRDGNLFARLASDKQVQLEAFTFDGNTTSQIRKLSLAAGGRERLDPAHLTSQLSTTGQVTALGAVIEEIAQQSAAGRLAGVVLFSDFSQNSGISPLADGVQSPLRRLGVPVYAVGVGPTEAMDLAVDLQIEPKMKKAVRNHIGVKLHASSLEGRSVTVRVWARKLAGDAAGTASPEQMVGQRTLTLQKLDEKIDFPFIPDEAGRFEFVAAADKLAGEVVDQNNRMSRQVNVIDDYLRLMYAAYEPTWEWRFIKEVFHRNPLVGMEGFRTFLTSSDPRVRESNSLFLRTLTTTKREFYANDVILIDDMPHAALSKTFCTWTEDYVNRLGGGLVILAGPRFGPYELAQTELKPLLPVVAPQTSVLHTAPDFPEFKLNLTPAADDYPFMKLGIGTPDKPWDNLSELPWYQPVHSLRDGAVALAVHPTDKCPGDNQLQPLIAIRRYGNGEVVYFAFNEMWRLRRQFGDKYYFDFWSQLITRLGTNHALGAEKRFVARLDRQQYPPGDHVTLSVEANDEDYEPLDDENLPARGLEAEMTMPASGAAQSKMAFTIPLLHRGLFEARIPVFAAGEHRVVVKDPITGANQELRFEVTPLSAERLRATRDDQLQNALARETGGRAYDLTTVHELLNDFQPKPIFQRTTHNYALWTTPLWFVTIVVLMLGEWLARKIIRLA